MMTYLDMIWSFLCHYILKLKLKSLALLALLVATSSLKDTKANRPINYLTTIYIIQSMKFHGIIIIPNLFHCHYILRWHSSN